MIRHLVRRGKYTLLLWLLGIFVFFLVMERYQEPVFAYAQASWESLSVQYQAHPVAFSAGFAAVYAAVVASFLPISLVLDLLAGAIFGVVWGTLLTSFGNTIGAVLNFLAARFLLRGKVLRAYPQEMERIKTGIAKDGWYYLMILRILPLVPGQGISVVVGASPFPLSTFAWVTLVFSVPMLAFYVFVGTQLSQLRRLEDVFSPEFIGASFLVALMLLFGKWFQKRKERVAA